MMIELDPPQCRLPRPGEIEQFVPITATTFQGKALLIRQDSPIAQGVTGGPVYYNKQKGLLYLLEPGIVVDGTPAHHLLTNEGF